MPEPVKMAFERQVVVLPLSNILPIKGVPDTIKQAMRYKRIVASIAEIGIVTRDALGEARPRSNTVDKQQHRGPGEHDHRCGGGSGQKTDGPVVRAI
jgi:hypothetical protein